LIFGLQLNDEAIDQKEAAMAEKMTTRLRKLLEAPELLVIPGGFSPLMARMAQIIGYEAFFMAGSQTAAFLHGLPDAGIITMNDMVDNARAIAPSCTIPIFADADTGYGNAVNAYYTVQEFVRAGVAGIHIEDQEAPKKSGTFAGRRCISVEEAIGKYQAAVAAKNELDPDFVICARCDSIGAEGGSFESAIERSIAYVKEAKVDAVWVNTLRSREEIQEACKRIPAPVIPPYYGPPPSPTLEEFHAMGAAAVLFPSLTTAVGLQAIWDFLHEFKERGTVAIEEWGRRAQDSRWGPLKRNSSPLLDLDKITELEEKYIPQALKRDYKGTFGHGTHFDVLPGKSESL
jgi:2-methylisocitrate lyase-like PEP mutase family enzyme